MGEGFQLLSLIYSLFLLFEYGYAGPLVPSIYVFGDSEVDSGNNNVLRTPAKADKLPYGIDLNNITGRFTNGWNIADIIGKFAKIWPELSQLFLILIVRLISKQFKYTFTNIKQASI